MKKTAFTFAVLVFLSLCLIISASAIIGGTATDVFFTQENVVGDPAAAEGFSLQSRFTLGGHAHWETTLTLGKNPTWNTDFSYTTYGRTSGLPTEPYIVLFGLFNFSIHGGTIVPKEEVGLAPFSDVLEKMVQDGQYTKTIPLSEVLDWFPLGLYHNSSALPSDTRESPEITAALTRLFHIPTDGYTVTIAIDTDKDQNIVGLDLFVSNSPNLDCPGVVVGNNLYLAFSSTDSITGETIPGCAPAGVYRIPILNPDSSPTLDEENTRLLSTLPQSVYLMETMGNGQEVFFLADGEAGILGGWMDGSTGEVLQTFQDTGDVSETTVFTEENHVVILSQPTGDTPPQRVSVWAKGHDGQYRKTIDADISQAAFSVGQSLCTLYDEAGNRLLIAAYTARVTPSLHVAVCQNDTMTYAATFISSQDELRTTVFFQAEEEFPRLYLAQSQ